MYVYIYYVYAMHLPQCTSCLIFGQSVTNREIGATEFRDYTNDSLDIINTKVQNGTDIQQCCNYEYQILDKFCARQPQVRIVGILLVCISICTQLLSLCQSLVVHIHVYIYLSFLSVFLCPLMSVCLVFICLCVCCLPVYMVNQHIKIIWQLGTFERVQHS